MHKYCLFIFIDVSATAPCSSCGAIKELNNTPSRDPGKLYVIGGADESGENPKTILQYNSKDGKWTILKSPTIAKHEDFGVAVLNRCIFAIGGYKSDAVIEKYDADKDRWEELAKLRRPRRGHSACAVDGRIYVFGGGEKGLSDTVEMYDSETNRWSDIAAMNHFKRMNAAIAVHKGSIIVLAFHRNGTSTNCTFSHRSCIRSRRTDWYRFSQRSSKF